MRQHSKKPRNTNDAPSAAMPGSPAHLAPTENFANKPNSASKQDGTNKSNNASEQSKQNKPNKAKLLGLRVLLIALICGALAGASYLAYQYIHLQQVAQEQANTAVPQTNQNTQDLPDNPIDFASLKAENSDIYAWIYIPNTNVNLPILQNPSNDFYYLTHNRSGDSAVEGAIYTELANATDFQDPVTLIYGHNMANGSMFSTLHFFENTEFYQENTTFYIYTEGHILTYQIVSAYQYDDRHILNSFDFSDQAELQAYFDSVCEPDSLVKNSTEGVTLDAQTSKLVQLSTCVGGGLSNRRYIVSGVLINDQATK